MSLFGAMRTSVSGMNAQSVRIGTVADNISNSSTTGYKRARAEFETILGTSTASTYTSGGVLPHVQSLNNEQGTLLTTGVSTDLAIAGSGYFVVRSQDGTVSLTRAGAFTPDEHGALRNTAGQYLLGVDVSANPGATTADVSSLVPIEINRSTLDATPSTSGFMTANLDSRAAVGTVSRTSLVAYDNLGAPVTIGFSFTSAVSPTATTPGQWSLALSGVTSPTGPVTLTFNPTTGAITSPTEIVVEIENGRPITLDLSAMTQLAAPFAVAEASIDGHAPVPLDNVRIDQNGVVSAVYKDGTVVPRFRIPLADVVSPDNLGAIAGNRWLPGTDSGQIVLSDAQTGGRGRVIAGALEASTVDLASELTTMIESQRAYTANSKVFQTGAELLEVLMSLKR